MTQLVDFRTEAPSSDFWSAPASMFNVNADGWARYDRRLIGAADARIGYAPQRGEPKIQCYGSVTTSLSAGGDVDGDVVDGSAVRLARIADPDDSGKWCWHWRINPNDPDTAASKRGEFAFSAAISQQYSGNVVVFGDVVRLPAALKTIDDDQLVWQWHGPDGANVGNPYVALLCTAGVLRIVLRYDLEPVSDPGTAVVLIPWTESHWTPDAWMRWVAVLRADYAGRGRALIMCNGRTVVDYTGPFGFNDDAVGTAYMKNGYYHWVNSGNDWDTSVNTRDVWHKGAYLANELVSANEMDDFLATL